MGHWTFEFEENKAVQSISWILYRLGGAVDKFRLPIILFYADREHLFRFGRPIIGGQYYCKRIFRQASYASTFELLDILSWGGIVGEKNNPFCLFRGNMVANPDTVIVDAEDCEYLSESDIEVLDWAAETYASVEMDRLRADLHSLKAWKVNAIGHVAKLPYEDWFLDNPDSDLWAIIAEDQEARGCFA